MVWQGSAGDRRPYADQTAISESRPKSCAIVRQQNHTSSEEQTTQAYVRKGVTREQLGSPQELYLVFSNSDEQAEAYAD